MCADSVYYHQDYSELLEDPKERRDSLVQKLRQRIHERDRALEVNTHMHKHTHIHTHALSHTHKQHCLPCELRVFIHSERWMRSSAVWRRKRRRLAGCSCCSERRRETWRGSVWCSLTTRRPSLYEHPHTHTHSFNFSFAAPDILCVYVSESGGAGAREESGVGAGV